MRSAVLAPLLVLGLASTAQSQTTYRDYLCDQDCTDLDLALTGEDDDTIPFEDELDDDAPVPQFVAPPVAVAFTLWVTMYACSVEPCSVAYQVYRR